MGSCPNTTGHVVDEAHVEHSVGLVEHNGLHPVEPHGAALHVVGQAARGRHNDLRLFLQRVDLLANGRAAVEAHHADAAHKNGQVAQLRRDLHGKLARRRHDDRLHLLAFGVNVLDDGNAEGKGLARSGGGLGDHVLPLAHRRDAARLHGGGPFDVFLFQCARHFRQQAKAVEAHALCEFHSVFLCSRDFQSEKLYHACQ